MKLPTHKKQLIFGLLILLNLIIRIPSIPHESGVDSFFIHGLATSITEFGYAKWWVNILSVSGFYPYSECSAVPFILSGISQSTGKEIESIILIVSIIFGILSVFTVYLLAGLISDDDNFKFFASFSYSLSPGILAFTMWNMSARGIYLVILPLFVYLLLKTKKSVTKYTFLSIFILLLLATVHHFIYFTMPIIFSYLLTVLMFNKIKNQNYLLNVAFIILFVVAFTMPFFTNTFIEHSKYTQLKEIILTNIRYTGFLLLFAISGFIYLSLKRNKNLEEWFVLVAMFFFAPLMWIQIYAFWFFLLYSCIFIGFSFTNLIKFHTRNKQYVTIILIIILCLSISMSSFYQHWRTGMEKNGQVGQWYMDEKSYSGALWTKDYIGTNKRLVGTDNLIDQRMFAVSGVPTLLDSSDVHMFVYGFEKIEDTPIVKHSPFSTQFYFDDPYSIAPNYTRVGYVKNHLMNQDIDGDTGSNIISRFNLSYLVENRLSSSNNFVQSVYRQKNSIYDNGKIVIWELM